MELQKQQLDEFFSEYCRMYNEGIRKELSASDLERVTSLYADCFISANPEGVNCSRNDDRFKRAMSKGYDFYRNIGIVKMEIISKVIAVLDNFHAMTKIRFKATFKRKDGTIGNVEFENIYFTQQTHDEPKVFAYISGDEHQTLKDSGLI